MRGAINRRGGRGEKPQIGELGEYGRREGEKLKKGWGGGGERH